MKTCFLAITGSISALKTPELVRTLKENGFDVFCCVTRAGREFVAPSALSAISGNSVLENEYFSQKLLPGVLADSGFPHLDFLEKIDVLLIAPATADTIARLAHGNADGLFETIALSTKKPILLAPAMNTEMFNSKIVQENIDTLKKRGMTILPTESGKLACGAVGEGRLLSSREIMLFVKRAVSQKSLSGEKVLITLGATEEPLDPVRVLTNKSSGKMGIALAKEAFIQGAEVHIIAGRVSISIPNIFENVTIVQTAQEMLKATQEKVGECNIAYFIAAVSDFTPAEYSEGKIPSSCSPSDKGELEGVRQEGGGISNTILNLKKTTDIASTLGKEKKQNQKFYGFALQTGNFESAKQKARLKMKEKNLDGTFLNFPNNLGGNSAKGTFLFENSAIEMSGTKEEIAVEIIKQ